jgi:multimeric flavodoxin WrbA
LKRSPEQSHTQGLADRSIEIMRRQGIAVDVIRAIDHDIATGVWPDMTEHGWERDEWPAIFEQVLAADILVLTTAIWLGEKTSVCTKVIERLYGNSHLLNEAGQYAYYGRVGGCLVTGNEDGVKHCSMNILYSLQHLGYVIPPQADAGWIGEAGPGPSYLDPGSGGPDNDFTNRNTTFMTWNLLHLARMLKDAGGIPLTGTSARSGTPTAASTSPIPSTADQAGTPAVWCQRRRSATSSSLPSQAVGASRLVRLVPEIRTPAVVVEIVARIIVGPSVLGWVEVDLPGPAPRPRRLGVPLVPGPPGDRCGRCGPRHGRRPGVSRLTVGGHLPVGGPEPSCAGESRPGSGAEAGIASPF